jgi:branched-subunit amino acid ABC-type transport system permease component
VAFGVAYGLFFLFLRTSDRSPQQLDNIPYFLFGVCIFLVWRNLSTLNIANLAVSAICALVAFPLWKQRDNPVLSYQLPVLIVLLAVFVVLALVPR